MNYTVAGHIVLGICIVFLGILYVFSPFSAINISRSVLFFQSNATTKPNTYRVISRPPMNRYDMLTISTIPGDIIEVGMCAYVDSVCLGYVQMVYTNTADIMLFSDSLTKENFAIDSFIGIGEGLGSGSFRMRIPSTNTVTVGDSVIHQKTGDTIGFVVALENKSESESEQYVYGHLKTSPFAIKEIYIPPLTQNKLMTTQSE